MANRTTTRAESSSEVGMTVAIVGALSLQLKPVLSCDTTERREGERGTEKENPNEPKIRRRSFLFSSPILLGRYCRL